jgi:hypothetical protein
MLRITGISPESITEVPHPEAPGGPRKTVHQREWDSLEAGGF